MLKNCGRGTSLTGPLPRVVHQTPEEMPLWGIGDDVGQGELRISLELVDDVSESGRKVEYLMNFLKVSNFLPHDCFNIRLRPRHAHEGVVDAKDVQAVPKTDGDYC